MTQLKNEQAGIHYICNSSPAIIHHKAESSVSYNFPWAGWPQACGAGEGLMLPCLSQDAVHRASSTITTALLPPMTLTQFPLLSFQKFLLSVLEKGS